MATCNSQRRILTVFSTTQSSAFYNIVGWIDTNLEINLQLIFNLDKITILPIIALVAGGRLGLKFATLYGTYKRWPKNKKLESMLLEKFSRVEFEKDLMGGAIMVAAFK